MSSLFSALRKNAAIIIAFLALLVALSENLFGVGLLFKFLDRERFAEWPGYIVCTAEERSEAYIFRLTRVSSSIERGQQTISRVGVGRPGVLYSAEDYGRHPRDFVLFFQGDSNPQAQVGVLRRGGGREPRVSVYERHMSEQVDGEPPFSDTEFGRVEEHEFRDCVGRTVRDLIDSGQASNQLPKRVLFDASGRDNDKFVFD